ncbi:cytochrome P450 [Trinickia acidisoli]|uniref:cytochrome P450 n=1 Tax=Trinickia acidisoli TaxID=2767482 RepID=UPI001A8EE01F|nr:cytochrome P450 [Trinickia acidisoli]
MSSPPQPKHPLGVWPPGPASLTGWGLLNRMSRDLLGTLGAWRSQFGDVVHLRIWPEHEVIVADPELVRELLVSHHDALIRWERGIRVFSQVHGHSVLVAEGEAWRNKRHAQQPSFSPKAVQSFLPTIADTVEQALVHWPVRDAHWPIESALTSLTMEVILQMTFSSGIGNDARIAEHAIRVTSAAANAEFYWPASCPDWVPWKRAKRRALADLSGLIERHVQTRSSMPRDAWPDDLLTRLLQLHEDEPSAWPLQAVRDECMTTFLAGHETTAATLVWWAWCMASNPSAQATAREEVRRVLDGRAPTAETMPSLPYLMQTIKETLRLYPVAPLLISRRSTRPIDLGPWQLPARTLFMLPVQLLHHDSRWFSEPEVFRPERFAADAPDIPRGAYMPFGTGPRVCLGQHLAMAEMTVIAAVLLQRFELSVPEGMAAPRPVLNVTLRPDRPVHLAIAPI